MWNGPYGMMGGWGGGGWFWPFHMIVPLVFFVLVIAAVVLLVRYAADWSDHPARPGRRPPGLDILEERYARGEINRDEYLEKKRDIIG